ncbi:MAG: GTP 3',8-cyclase MoaA [Desulfitobacterium hafniense]|nr:GTP 3',8-cyclase MoaA [Desulfitobacterium hafniense]
MLDQYKRQIEYMRISVTDRCNLRCRYCMPETGIEWLPHEDILTYEEILQLMRISIQFGFKSFRITGGEPLVRKGIIDFIRQAVQLPGVEDLMVTTNGLMLPDMAFDLKAAGVNRINISLDSLEQLRYEEITRGGQVERVIQGIFRSIEAGLSPVKVNCVVVRSFNLDELPRFVELAKRYPIHVRFIELMPIGISSDRRQDFVPIKEMKEILGLKELDASTCVKGSGPAQAFIPDGFIGSVGFISALSRHFCHSCNRVRLTADGKLRACLHSKHEVDLRSAMRSGLPDAEIAGLFASAVWNKPAQHHMNDQVWQDRRIMSQIGG